MTLGITRARSEVSFAVDSTTPRFEHAYGLDRCAYRSEEPEFTQAIEGPRVLHPKSWRNSTKEDGFLEEAETHEAENLYCFTRTPVVHDTKMTSKLKCMQKKKFHHLRCSADVAYEVDMPEAQRFQQFF